MKTLSEKNKTVAWCIALACLAIGLNTGGAVLYKSSKNKNTENDMKRAKKGGITLIVFGCTFFVFLLALLPQLLPKKIDTGRRKPF
jgi:glutamate racemase